MMAKLAHDAQGFLVGNPVDLGRISRHLIDIRDDIAAIKNATIGTGKALGKALEQSTTTVTATPPRPKTTISIRDVGGRFVSRQQKPVNPIRGKPNNVTALTRTLSSDHAKPNADNKPTTRIAEPRKRDDSGRFTNKDGDTGNNAIRSATSKLTSLADRAGSVASSSMSDVDPSIKAFGEVAEPLQRGIGFFRRDDDKQTGLLRKIFKGLTRFQKSEGAFNKLQLKLLKEIEEKPVGGSVHYQSSTSILDKIPVVWPTIKAIGNTAVGGGLLGILAKGGKALKRIPVLGALLASAGAALDIFESESNNALSRHQKDAAAGNAIGGWTGSLGGTAAGALAGSMAGPIGTVVGGVVGAFLGDQAGQIIGRQFGEWISDLRDYDLTGKIVDSWRNAVDGIVELASKALVKVTDIGGKAVDVAKEHLNDANNYIKANTGVNLKELGNAWWKRTSNNVAEVWQATRSAASNTADWLGNSTTLGHAAKRAVKNLKTGGAIGSPELAMQILMEKGWSKEQSAGIAANLKSESGFNTGAVGDSGKALGIAQWHPDRQRQFESVFGKKLRDATFSEQVDFIDWELRNTEKTAGARIRSAKTPEQAAIAVDKFYERSLVASRGGVNADRVANAVKYAQITSVSPDVPVLSAPIMPKPAPVEAAPAITQPLGQLSPSFTVNLPSQDIGRDLSDRRIAHIATGGLSG